MRGGAPCVGGGRRKLGRRTLELRGTLKRGGVLKLDDSFGRDWRFCGVFFAPPRPLGLGRGGGANQPAELPEDRDRRSPGQGFGNNGADRAGGVHLDDNIQLARSPGWRGVAQALAPESQNHGPNRARCAAKTMGDFCVVEIFSAEQQ